MQTPSSAAANTPEGARGALRHEMPTWECVSLLESHAVGRLCVIDQGYPLAFPINYRLETSDDGNGHHIVFRSAPHTALARHTGPSSLEIDEIDGEGGTAWSIIARGNLHPVHGDHTLRAAAPSVSVGRDQWLVLDVTGISGRRFVKVVRDGATDADAPDEEWGSPGDA